MKHLAAYLLLNLAGKTPNEKSIKSLLDTVGIEADDDRLKQVLKELDGKDIEELVNSGLSKLASVPTGGGGGAASSGGGAAAGGTAAAESAPAEEAKKEEEKEESDDDMGFGLFD